MALGGRTPCTTDTPTPAFSSTVDDDDDDDARDGEDAGSAGPALGTGPRVARELGCVGIEVFECRHDLVL